VYAGAPSNWGTDFTVGAVPVFKYLESRDVDEVGYTLRTASLMTGPEYLFDERNPSDYELFAVHFTILPLGTSPPIAERLIACAGRYCLWRTAAKGYVHAGVIAGVLAADRTDVGARSRALLGSALARRGAYLRVAYGHSAGGVTPRLPAVAGDARAGTVTAERDGLADGEVTATVRMNRAGVAVLSSSFDPGWAAAVDGRPQPTMMVAPALVGIAIPPGAHRLTLRFRGRSRYDELFAVSLLSLTVLALASVRTRRSRSRAGSWSRRR
jgi:hypothetical protein